MEPIKFILLILQALSLLNQSNSIILGQVLRTWVQLMLGKCASHVRPPFPVLATPIQLPLTCTLGGNRGWTLWVPDIHRANTDLLPGSRLQPGQALAATVIWSEPADGRYLYHPAL